MAQQKYDIFISYRRKGGSERAQLLRMMFVNRGFASGKVFMDTQSLGSNDVKTNLKKAIEASENIIVLITKGSFDRIKNDDLWIFEIKEAIRLHKNIIPVFFDGLTSFESTNLPEEVSSIGTYNGVIYNHNYADAFYDKLCSFLVRKNLIYKKPIIILSIIIVCVFAIFCIYNFCNINIL